MTDNNPADPTVTGPIWITVAPSTGTITQTQPILIPIQQTFTWVTPPIPCIPDNSKTCSEEKKKNSDGCVCKKCKELFPYAEPNQDDGTLICYGCRMVW